MGSLFSRQDQYQTIPDTPATATAATDTTNEPSPESSLADIYMILQSYFWPDSGSDSALMNRLRSTMTWVMVVLSKGCNIISPLYLSYGTDNLINHQVSQAVWNILIYCLLRFLSFTFKEFQSIIYLKVKQQANIQLAHRAFSHIHQLSLNWHLNKKMGNIMRIMDRGTSAADTLVTYLCLYLVPAFLECFAVCIFFIIKFQEWKLSVIVIAGVVLYSITTILITRWRKQFREASNKHDNDYHDKATDSIVNYETVKYFNGEDFEVNRFKSLISDYQSVNVMTTLSISILNISQQFIMTLTLLGTMYIAGRKVLNGKITIGNFIAVNTYTLSVFMPLFNLGMIYNMTVQGLIDFRQFMQLLLTVPEILDEENAPEIPLVSSSTLSKYSSSAAAATDQPMRSIHKAAGAGVSVEFKDVIFHYPSQPPSSGLKGISFFVPPGTTTAIVGHSGSGKTTVSRLLFRFYDPLHGEIKIGDYNIRHYTQKTIRQCIGIVPQDTVLFNDTLYHNIHYGNMAAAPEEVYRVAEQAKIKEFVETLPENWETQVGERGLKLSGGEKQRVAIARCLLKNPPVVILDEATSALDTITERSVQESLNALGYNRTVIVIAHRLSTIMNADQILVMDSGEIIERGTHEELLQIPEGRYVSLWKKQYKSVDGADPTSPETMSSLSPPPPLLPAAEDQC